MIIKKLKVVKKVKKTAKTVKRGKHKPAKLTDNKKDIVERETNANANAIKKSDNNDIEVSEIYANKNLTVNEIQGILIFLVVMAVGIIITLASIYIYGQEK